MNNYLKTCIKKKKSQTPECCEVRPFERSHAPSLECEIKWLPNAIERVEILEGTFSAYFIVNLITKYIETTLVHRV